MEDNANLIESLLERAAEYGKTSYELVKLNVVDKTSDSLSSFLPHAVAVAIVVFFMLFLNLGIALWLGEILGKLYYGFLLVGGLFAFLFILFHFFLRKWVKRLLYDHMIKQLLNQ
jgi:hypothetical protein